MSSGKRVAFVALIAALALAGCGKKTPPEQVLVTGDGFEITLSELDHVLRNTPPVPKEQVAPARRKILDELIGQKLLAEAAKKDGLDHDTATVEALEASRRAILADVYVRRLAGTPNVPGDAEIRAYYDAHPADFAQRSEIALAEFTVPLGDKHLQDDIAALSKDDFAALAKRIYVDRPSQSESAVIRMSSDLSEGGGRTDELKPGGKVIYREGQVVHLGEIRSVTPRPVSLDDARDLIVARIQASRGKAMVERAISDLRRSRHVAIVNTSLKEQPAP
jgi:EpsD family peptidyl-prolyl cis-trans isomerase